MELPDVVKEKMIELDDENNQLRAEVKRLRASIVKKDEILNELEEENVHLLAAKQEISSANAKCAQLEQKIVSLRVTLEEKTRESYNLMHEVETLTASLVSARPLSTEDIVKPSNREEIMRMQEEKDDALFELQEAKKRILELETERKELIERAEVANAEAWDVDRHLKETRQRILELESERKDLIEREEAANAEARHNARQLKDTREEMHELETKLAISRTNPNIADRGNSMFAEVCSALRARDKLIEEKADLEVRVANVEKWVADAKEDIGTVKLQLAMMKEGEQKKDAAKGMCPAPKTAERPFSGLKKLRLADNSMDDVESTKESNRTASCWILFLRRFRKKKRCLSMNHQRVNKHHGKLRLANNSVNDEEDHSRRASISASELRRIPQQG